MSKVLHASCFAAAVALAGPAAAQTADQDPVERGRYLATLADCVACHTAPGGAEFAGGYAIELPLGTIWSTNITPSKSHGIGDYSQEEFARALRRGLARDGRHLYPAMPYDAYAGITDEDIAALYAYFTQGVAPVDAAPGQRTSLAFPFNMRFAMTGWNLLYAGGDPFTPDPALTEAQNRGRYLVNALAHCGSCHSPRGLLMGPVRGAYLTGGDVGPWYAPDITADAGNGIGTWSPEQIAAYLGTGHAEGRGQAGGPMAEAVQNSLQHVTDDDRAAMAAYLKTVAPKDAGSGTDATSFGAPKSDEATLRGTHPQNANDGLTTGAELFSGYCASCHQPDGAGSTGQSYPPLFHNSATGAASATNLIAAILYGVDRRVGDAHVFMPHFNKGSFVGALSDEEIAGIANYVLTTWGNAGAANVTVADVAQSRQGGPVAPLARLQPYLPAIMVVGAVVLLFIIAAMIRLIRGRRRAVA